MRFDIRYRTTFTYDDLVRESHNELRACPASDDHQQLISYRVHSAPSARVMSFGDYWGTRVDAFGVRVPHLSLEVNAEASVETRARALLTVAPRDDLLRSSVFIDEHLEYLGRSPHCDWEEGIENAARGAAALAGPGVVSRVLAAHRFVGTNLSYASGRTSVGEPVEDVLSGGFGVCQDFAHLAVALCRAMGIPARYVSGYLFTTDDATGEDSEGHVVNVQTHAWFEAAIPGFGWFALDPTNQLEVGQRHVKIGHGRDYDDVPPLRGVYSGPGRPSVEVTVEIKRTTGSPPGRPEPPKFIQRYSNLDAEIDNSKQHQQGQQQQ